MSASFCLVWIIEQDSFSKAKKMCLFWEYIQAFLLGDPALREGIRKISEFLCTCKGGQCRDTG